jgi:hypothetical protein
MEHCSAPVEFSQNSGIEVHFSIILSASNCYIWFLLYMFSHRFRISLLPCELQSPYARSFDRRNNIWWTVPGTKLTLLLIPSSRQVLFSNIPCSLLFGRRNSFPPTESNQTLADHWTPILSQFSLSPFSESGLWGFSTLQVPDLKTRSVRWLNKATTRSVWWLTKVTARSV